MFAPLYSPTVNISAVIFNILTKMFTALQEYWSARLTGSLVGKFAVMFGLKVRSYKTMRSHTRKCLPHHTASLTLKSVRLTGQGTDKVIFTPSEFDHTAPETGW